MTSPRSSSSKWTLAFNITFLLAVVGYYYFFLYRTPVTALEPGSKSLAAMPLAPATLDAESLKIAAPQALETYKGQVLFLHLWASWCTSCRAEMSSLRDLRSRISASRLRMLGIAVQDEPKDIENFLRSTHFPLEVYFDREGVASQILSAKSIPQSAIVDQQGFLRLKIEGALRESHFEMIDRLLRELGV